ncbi:MAG: nucleotidyltransferase domain-containing protein [Deltaproteobacteria bacterium]|nr:nucleotidyltransferase domain-containing protein [Deltaproteobacteria bacterium]
MNREAIIKTLGAHREELRQRGDVSLALFGSTARNQAGQTSDVDLLTEFDRTLSPCSRYSTCNTGWRISWAGSRLIWCRRQPYAPPSKNTSFPRPSMLPRE